MRETTRERGGVAVSERDNERERQLQESERGREYREATSKQVCVRVCVRERQAYSCASL